MSELLSEEVITEIIEILLGWRKTDDWSDSPFGVDQELADILEIDPYKLNEHSQPAIRFMCKSDSFPDDYECAEDELDEITNIFMDELTNRFDLIELFCCLIDTPDQRKYFLLEDKKYKNGYIRQYGDFGSFSDLSYFVASLDKNSVSKKLIEFLLNEPNECLYTDISLNPDYLPKKDFLKILLDEKRVHQVLDYLSQKGWPTEYPPIENWIEKYYESKT